MYYSTTVFLKLLLFYGYYIQAVRTLRIFTENESPVQLRILPASGAVYEGDTVTVTCSLQGVNKRFNPSSVHLYCPLLPERTPCFTDCQSPCRGETCASKMNAITCSDDSSFDQRILRYRILRTTKDHQGVYYCSYRGKYSERLPLAVLEPTSTPTSTTITTPQSRIPTKLPADVIPVTTKSSFSTLSQKENNPIKSTDRNKNGIVWIIPPPVQPNRIKPIQDDAVQNKPVYVYHWKSWAPGIREQAYCVIAIAAIFFVSFIANIICCTRIILIGHYSKDRRRKVRMGDCLCISGEIAARREAKSNTEKQFYLYDTVCQQMTQHEHDRRLAQGRQQPALPQSLRSLEHHPAVSTIPTAEIKPICGDPSTNMYSSNSFKSLTLPYSTHTYGLPRSQTGADYSPYFSKREPQLRKSPSSTLKISGSPPLSKTGEVDGY